MNDFFANLFEFFGLIPVYSSGLSDHLRGLDILCSNYIDTPRYLYVGMAMVFFVVAGYVLQYHILDTARWNKRRHWWITAAIIAGLSFFVAFAVPLSAYQTGDYCAKLRLSILDFVLFGASVAFWSLVSYMLLTSPPIPRAWAGKSANKTTFWRGGN